MYFLVGYIDGESARHVAALSELGGSYNLVAESVWGRDHHWEDITGYFSLRHGVFLAVVAKDGELYFRDGDWMIRITPGLHWRLRGVAPDRELEVWRDGEVIHRTFYHAMAIHWLDAPWQYHYLDFGAFLLDFLEDNGAKPVLLKHARKDKMDPGSSPG